MLKVKEKDLSHSGSCWECHSSWGRGHESDGSRSNGLRLGLAEEQRDPVVAVAGGQLPGNTADCCSLYDPWRDLSRQAHLQQAAEEASALSVNISFLSLEGRKRQLRLIDPDSIPPHRPPVPDRGSICFACQCPGHMSLDDHWARSSRPRSRGCFQLPHILEIQCDKNRTWEIWQHLFSYYIIWM